MPRPEASPGTPSGAAAQSVPGKLALGRVLGGHGVRGLARVKSFNADSPVLLEASEVDLVSPGGARQSFRVLRRQPHRDQVLLGFAGIDSLDALEPWLGATVEIAASELPPAGEGQLYHFEAIGLRVETTTGNVIGTVVEVLTLPAHDVWRVRRADTTPAEHADEARADDVLIPLVGAIVREIDLRQGHAIIDPPAGLLDDGAE